MKKINCKNKINHTKCPKTYLEWMDWATDMTKKGYKQRVCPMCGRYEIWYNPINTKAKKKISINPHQYI